MLISSAHSSRGGRIRIKNKDIDELPIRDEIFGQERLNSYAQFLAENLQVSDEKFKDQLLTRLKKNYHLFILAYDQFYRDLNEHIDIPPAGMWIIDNHYIIEEQFLKVKHDLPKKYYHELPKIVSGELRGYPRVYSLALTLIAHLDSHLETKTLLSFFSSFQQKTSLNSGEIWAIPITLRIALLENLRRILIQIIHRQLKRNEAKELALKLFSGDQDPVKTEKQLRSRIFESDSMACIFIGQIYKQIREVSAESSASFNIIQEYLTARNLTIDDIINSDHLADAHAQVTLGNIITSMRLISSVDWRDFFESISPVEEILEQDPSGFYSNMNFLTRDRYRHIVEKISKKTSNHETEIANFVLKSAREAFDLNREDLVKSHVGHYLIDEGVGIIEKEFRYRRSLKEKIQFQIKSHPNLFYFSFLLILEALLIFILLKYEIRRDLALIVFIVALIPVSDIALNLLNLITNLLLTPSPLPKLEVISNEDEARTFIVVPTIVSDSACVKKRLADLEVHYYSNRENFLYYAILSDFADSMNETESSDELLLKELEEGITSLNQRHANGTPRFYFFHRPRLWNPQENCWMGWERKRGKLEEFNRFLKDPSFMPFINRNPQGLDRKLFQTIRFVITLDSDTVMPMETAKKLIGTALHPLNRPQLNQNTIERGYVILQPRISIKPTSACLTLFSKIYSGHTGIDPYTTAVSDAYQDLYGTGIFVGKGLYHVNEFSQLTENKIKENSILSHDLFEGLLARTALVTDIELMDDYPSKYRTYSKRLHRWTRGDWQIARFALPGQVSSFNFSDRWKILDNLRRSSVAFFTFLWITLLMAFSQKIFASLGLMIFIFILPVLFQTLRMQIKNFNRVSLKYNLKDSLDHLLEGLVQKILFLVLLPHQAWISLDAIVRTLYRMNVSKKHLLEWTTAEASEKDSLGDNAISWEEKMALVLACSIVLIAALFSQQWLNKLAVIPFFLAWIFNPLILKRIECLTDCPSEFTLEDKKFLKSICRRTWNFFETFANEENNWLAPDNFQETPKPVVANRTSPTNIGAMLLSTASAYDMGYLGIEELLSRLERAQETLSKLDKFNGHFYNWYDTKTLTPLYPIYISTVDSGNLAAFSYVIKIFCEHLKKSPLLGEQLQHGLRDTFHILKEESEKISERFFKSTFHSHMAHEGNEFVRKLDQLISTSAETPPSDFEAWKKFIHKLQQQAHQLNDLLESLIVDHGYRHFRDLPHWMKWTLKNIDELSHLIEQIEINSDYQQQILNRIEALEKFYFTTAMQMDFLFLYDKERKIFSIGYNLTEGRMDNAFYDLLASESRLASFFAIAKGEIPVEHWFHLGRQMSSIKGRRALISWTASMFEYLMPLLVMKNFNQTLLNQTYDSIVESQQEYLESSDIPWGISESAYNARDLNQNYQYGPFGIPGLGLKYGLGADTVISPYSTGLAAMIDAPSAVMNFKRLSEENAFGLFGYYEAIDYTTARLPKEKRKQIIRSFMAHHQGMIFVSLNNVLNDSVMQKRFHDAPMIRAAELLLQEKIPEYVTVIPQFMRDTPVKSNVKKEKKRDTRIINNIHTLHPVCNILSNGNYTVMTSTTGSGFSRFKELAVTRWTEDPTLDAKGSFIYLHDINEGLASSVTYQPMKDRTAEYSCNFMEHKSEFSRKTRSLTTHMEIIISSEDNIEIRKLTLTNTSSKTKKINLTSYMEPVLARAQDDAAHLSFSKLFLETHYVNNRDALLIKRRKRFHEDKERWGFHTVTTDAKEYAETEFETDRLRFLGRNRNPANAMVITDNLSLSGTTGTVLDPILSLKKHILIEPGSTVHVMYTTGMAQDRDDALRLVDQYSDLRAFDREQELSWTQHQVKLRHMNMSSEDSLLYQELSGAIIFANPLLRASQRKMSGQKSGQNGLWAFGISGDLPIIAVRMSSEKDLQLARTLIKAHEFFRTKNIPFDLLLLNDEKTTYRTNLHDELIRQLHLQGSAEKLNKSAGIFLISTVLLKEEEINLLHAYSRILLDGNKGSLRDQIEHLRLSNFAYQLNEKKLLKVTRPQYENQEKLVQPELIFFNGLGGFSPDGDEYQILLNKGVNTPAPWINVISNSHNFGFTISETGSGFTWAKNSRENRLTPWNNDPVTDASGEALYIRDEETFHTWSALPSPMEFDSPYLVSHGQGYSRFNHNAHGFAHSFTTYVSLDDSVKIMTFKIKNICKYQRKLSCTFFAEWVLGFSRAQTSAFIATENDGPILSARNPFNIEFPNEVAFCAISGSEINFTSDRTEFLGRDASYADPLGMKVKFLSQKCGAGIDPCAALRTFFMLEPGEEQEVTILLGQAQSKEKAKELVSKYLHPETTQKEWEKVRSFWKNLNASIQIKTPSQEMDLIINNWVLYQTLSCRIWARSALYQSGGAYGFRDQLQDSLALLYSLPEFSREHIKRCAAQQFIEGDVQHWWHPPSNKGVRTRFSDDLLWLPYVVFRYIQRTNDWSILDEQISFIEAPLLKEGQEDLYISPQVSQEHASLYEHCLRAINRSMKTGQHDLPLMGAGDWNDGMNNVGLGGKGESVWVAWFLAKILNDFSQICFKRGDLQSRERFINHAQLLRDALEKNAWDGDWYLRAFFDDGTPLGSKQNDECQIDSLSQSWSVLTGVGDKFRSKMAMNAVYERLVKREDRLCLLFTPPFDNGPLKPGYIKGYPPGIRENGGQYSHAAAWCSMAFAQLEENEKAYEVLSFLNPVTRTRSFRGLELYKVEPYVIAADIYGGTVHKGRGGWSWYTGSSALYYQAALEYILGMTIVDEKLFLKPCVPDRWKNYSIQLKWKSSVYQISFIRNENSKEKAVVLEMDGQRMTEENLPLVDDQQTHKIICRF